MKGKPHFLQRTTRFFLEPADSLLDGWFGQSNSIKLECHVLVSQERKEKKKKLSVKRCGNHFHISLNKEKTLEKMNQSIQEKKIHGQLSLSREELNTS